MPTMRTVPRSTLALVVAVAAVPVSTGAVATPAAVAQDAPDACDQALNPDRRSVYRYKDGRRTLPFGRVVVTATKADRHRYCIRVQFDGRRVFNSFGLSSYLRRNGKWVNEGGLGDSGSVGPSYTQTMQVRDKTRIDRSYGIRYRGRSYSTISISRYNL